MDRASRRACRQANHAMLDGLKKEVARVAADNPPAHALADLSATVRTITEVEEQLFVDQAEDNDDERVD